MILTWLPFGGLITAGPALGESGVMATGRWEGTGPRFMPGKDRFSEFHCGRSSLAFFASKTPLCTYNIAESAHYRSIRSSANQADTPPDYLRSDVAAHQIHVLNGFSHLVYV